MKRILPIDIIKFKNQKKIVALTAYDYLLANLLDNLEIDIILVGDSLGNVFNGYKNTLPVTIEDMLYHTKAVARSVKHAMVLADMPFMSYQISVDQARLNAGRLLKEAGATAVKMEITDKQIDLIKAVTDIGIPVVGHIGFTPQYLYQLGGYKIQGREKEATEKLVDLAIELEKNGCFALLLEMMPKELAKKITEQVNIPTISCGAGPFCDGQVLVTNDILGYNEPNTKPLTFVKRYANLTEIITNSVNEYKKEVESGIFPSDEHSF